MPHNGEPDQLTGPPPAKKRKLMHVPDGFEDSKRSNGRAAARKFASAFDDHRKSKLSAGDTLGRLQTRLGLPPVAGPSRDPGQATAASRVPITRVSKIPVLQHPVAGPSSRPLQSRNASILAAHRISSPAPERSRAKKPVSKGTLQQFQPVLPPSKDPPRNLRPLQPPPPPAVGSPGPDPSKMKTISTTRVAVAMDPRMESGTDELLGIYLEQRAGNYVPPAERELQRGLGQSPEKASKSKSAKFVRGGLAERAQHVYARHNTTLTLWYKDMELQEQRPQAHSRLAPDVSLTIVEVLHTTSVATLQRSQSVPRLCVARCLKTTQGKTEEEGVVAVLDFGNSGSASARAHTLDDIKEGKHLHVWRPWNTISAGGDSLARSGAATSLQLPRDCAILFCTRFRIIE
ncbi:hypothetical protein BD414DRAFT_581222 [Trametes punicea]|nr:hypothetical protein BD414DRAFT_581222 [Trametes punicea]